LWGNDSLGFNINGLIRRRLEWGLLLLGVRV
jgi:hypothetical protein